MKAGVERHVFRILLYVVCGNFGYPSFFPHPLLHFRHHFRRIILEEIEVHGLGDFQDKVAVKGRLVEDLNGSITRSKIPFM